MTTYELLKTLHVIAAIVWVGGAITFNLLGTRLSKADNPNALAAVAKEMEKIGNAVFLPSSLVLLGFGIWMVVISGWDFSDLWIVIGIAGVVATAITGSTIIGPRLKKLGAMIDERGAEDPAVQAGIVNLTVVSRIDLVVLLVVVIDMVIKPGA